MKKILCFVAFLANATTAFAGISLTDGSPSTRNILLKNSTPIAWTAIQYRLEPNLNEEWFTIEIDGAEALPSGTTLELTIPASGCSCAFKVSGSDGGDTLTGEYRVDVCNDPAPEFR